MVPPAFAPIAAAASLTGVNVDTPRHPSDDLVRYGSTSELLYLKRNGQQRGTGSFGKGDLLLLDKVAEQTNEGVEEMQLGRPL